MEEKTKTTVMESSDGKILGTVASGHELTSYAMRMVLEKGGNAYDAVVAAGFASAVSEPAFTSVGGGGFVLARTKDGEETLFDFFVDTPGLGIPREELIRQTENLKFTEITVTFASATQSFNIGRASIAVPGVLKGLLHVHQKLGRLSLSEVVEPAIQMARQGIRVKPLYAIAMHLLEPIFTLTEAGRNLYLPNGSKPEVGDLVFNTEYADFLEELAKESISLYNSPLSNQLERDLKGYGLLTEEDLSHYEVIERTPLYSMYRGHRVLTNPPPSLGGSFISNCLAKLESIPRSKLGKWGSPEHIVTVAKIMQEVETSNRDSITLDDLVVSADLMEENDHQRDEENSIRKEKDEDDEENSPRVQFHRGTTHVSVIDSEGNLASMTTSNGEGSGYVVDGTGIMLNNMLGEDDLYPVGVDRAKMLQYPGRRVASSMAPCIALKFNDKNEVDTSQVLVVGSAGSKRIRTALLQILVNSIDFGMSPEEAVLAPRVHFDGEMLQVEPGYPQETLDALTTHFQLNLWNEVDLYFGGANAVSPTEACGDIRRSCSGMIISSASPALPSLPL